MANRAPVSERRQGVMNADLHGTSATPLLGETIGENLRRTVERFGDRDALVVRSQNYRATYRQLWDRRPPGPRADRVGRRRATASASGRRIASSGSCTQYATARIGAILVNINPAYKSPSSSTRSSSPASPAAPRPAFRKSDYVRCSRRCGPAARACARPIAIDADWQALLERAHASSDRELAEREATLQFDDPINIQYTSGTTGFPKGATLSHHNILNNGFFVGEALSTPTRPRLHPGAVLPLLRDGAGQPRLHVARRLHGRPGRGVRPAGDPGNDRGRALHVAVRRADHVHRATRAPALRRVRSRLAAHRHHGGLALPRRSDEAGPVADAHARGHHRLRHDRDVARLDAERWNDPLERRVSTVGRVHPHVEIKIVDPETGAVVPRGAPGELCTRGYGVMLGYWNDEATRDAIDAAGWMHTGDLATMDEEGYVNIVGRIKDMIIRGGENIYPREIEEFLYTHTSVLEAQVIGVPSEKYGEEVMAWVKVRPGHTVTDEDLIAFCRGRIATFKIPRFWKFVTSFR